MAGNMIANTFATYDAVGDREDLIDIIFNVSPMETPFVTSIAKNKAVGQLHEWQVDSLASASTSNAQVQGDDIVSFDAVTPTARHGNRTQIFRKDFLISGTQEVVLKAGRRSEVAYQTSKKGREIKRDIELIMLNNQAKVTAASGTAPKLAGVPSWLVTNISFGSGGAAPTGDGSDTVTAGSNRTFTEAQLKTVLASVFNNAGDQPDLILMPASIKQAASAFPGNSTRYIDAQSKELVAGVAVYYSDFGEHKLVPERFMNANTAFVINSDLWAVSWLRPLKLVELATTGDAEKRMIVGEATLEARNELGNGAIYAITA